MQTAEDYYDHLSRNPAVSSGDTNLDELLHGGFHKDSTNFLFGTQNIISLILMKTVVNFISVNYNPQSEGNHVLYIDGDVLFNPCFIAKIAAIKHVSPSFVMDRIKSVSLPEFEQAVRKINENNQTTDLQRFRLIIVTGLAHSVQNFKQRTSMNHFSGSAEFFRIKTILGYLNRIRRFTNPVIILTGSAHPKYPNFSTGGNLITHISSIVIHIQEEKNCIDYTLIHHPFLPNQTIKTWKSADVRNLAKGTRNYSSKNQNITLDAYFQNSSLRKGRKINHG